MSMENSFEAPRQTPVERTTSFDLSQTSLSDFNRVINSHSGNQSDLHGFPSADRLLANLTDTTNTNQTPQAAPTDTTTSTPAEGEPPKLSNDDFWNGPACFREPCSSDASRLYTPDGAAERLRQRNESPSDQGESMVLDRLRAWPRDRNPYIPPGFPYSRWCPETPER